MRTDVLLHIILICISPTVSRHITTRRIQEKYLRFLDRIETIGRRSDSIGPPTNNQVFLIDSIEGTVFIDVIPQQPVRKCSCLFADTTGNDRTYRQW